MDLKVSGTKVENLQNINKSTENLKTEDFKFTLNRISGENITGKLSLLAENIKVQGDKLAKHLDIRDMKNYRVLITEFMTEVVSNSHLFSRENFLDRRGRHRVYGIIKLINKELDELAKKLLQEEKKHIEILDKTGEILGLLLDLFI